MLDYFLDFVAFPWVLFMCTFMLPSILSQELGLARSWGLVETKEDSSVTTDPIFSQI